MDPIAKHFIIVVILVSVAAIVKCDISDVCSTYSGRRIYIDQDGSGHIHAANISTTNQKNVRFLSIKIVIDGHMQI